MTENIKLPRKLSEEPEIAAAAAASHADVIENLDRWANSPELQPPTSPDEDGLNGLGRLEAGRNRRHPGKALRRAKQPNAG
ncbi:MULTISPECIES: hypothetical protein [unclassified Bradyrhizobium]|uniref:hypothetical protein n=1 Tax=unclassified Bradyrhizobium TaxID=2631580 RepID=UPI002FF403F3